MTENDAEQSESVPLQSSFDNRPRDRRFCTWRNCRVRNRSWQDACATGMAMCDPLIAHSEICAAALRSHSTNIIGAPCSPWMQHACRGVSPACSGLFPSEFGNRLCIERDLFGEGRVLSRADGVKTDGSMGQVWSQGWWVLNSANCSQLFPVGYN